MPKLNQRGAAHFLVPLILLAGLIAGVYLVTSGNPLQIFSQAANPPIVFKDLNGQPLPKIDGVFQTTSATVRVELTSKLGPPATVSGPIVTKGTVSYRTGFSPDEVHRAIFSPYLREPTVYNLGLRNTTDAQSYWVEFKGSDGTLDRRVGKIKLTSIPTSTPSPTPTTPSFTPGITPVPTPSPVSNAFSMEVKISSNIGVGTTDFPNVFIDNAVNLGAFEYTLKFDPTKLKVLNMALERFLGSTGRQVSQLGPIIDNVKGTVNFGGYTLGANPPGPNGKGVLAIFNVQALAPGSTSITISYAKVTDPTGTIIQPVGNLISGTVNITHR